jgi:hypothetical protein
VAVFTPMWGQPPSGVPRAAGPMPDHGAGHQHQSQSSFARLDSRGRLSPHDRFLKGALLKRAPTTPRGMMVVWMIPWKSSQELGRRGSGEMSAIK